LYSAISDIYLAKGDTTTALKTISDARKQFPQEAGFITSEFNLYFSMKQMDRAKQALDEAMVAYKDDKDMLRNLKFNAGFIYDQKKDYETARKYYKEALELDPKFSEAMNNLAGTYLEEANPIINEMNALPLNETAKYKAMKEKASALYKEAGTILEQAYELNPNDKLKRTLADLYGFLGDEEKEMKYSK
ncbi:MAG: tetratricopeptide repeat protein, partial [Flavobacteriales bacterium]